MSRVKAVVDGAIMVHVHDVQVNDVISIRGDEADPIIDRIEVDGDKRKFIYKRREGDFVQETAWLDPDLGRHVFLHDLHREAKR